MNSPEGPIKAYRHYWLPELIVLVTLSLATVILYASTDLDITTVRPYYHPERADAWPVAEHPFWRLFYRSAPWVTGSLAVAGVALLVIGMLREKKRQYRWYGIFLLLCVIIGPGLIINAVLKDHWGRPRPRQLVEYGGQLHYVLPLFPAGAHGKSFPCGHCSVGYLYAVGWWLCRRRHPLLAVLSLTAGLVLGTLLGIGRMAAGAHFISDAFWAALIAYGTAHILYYYILRIPAREDYRPNLYPLIVCNPLLKAATIWGAVVLGAGIIGGGILASPCDRDLTERVCLSDYPKELSIVELRADTLDVELKLVTEPDDMIECSGAIYGFGLPNNEFKTKWEYEQLPVPRLTYRIIRRGFFTDVDGNLKISIPVRNLKKIMIRIKHGNISVVDATADSRGADQLPELDLVTVQGIVRQ
jgi:membrane-associated PAP2 superfamily phosphatase